MENGDDKNINLREQLGLFPDWFQPNRDPHGLTMRHRLFVLHYVGEAKGNATRAAEMAGFRGKNIRVTASKLLSKDNIQKAIEDRKRALVEKIKSDHLKTLRMLEAHAFSDIRNVFEADGSLKPLDEIDDETAMAIESVETEEVRRRNGKMTVRKVKLTPKASARADLLKVQGLLRDTVDLNTRGELGVIYFPEKKDVGEKIEGSNS